MPIDVKGRPRQGRPFPSASVLLRTPGIGRRYGLLDQSLDLRGTLHVLGAHRVVVEVPKFNADSGVLRIAQAHVGTREESAGHRIGGMRVPRLP